MKKKNIILMSFGVILFLALWGFFGWLLVHNAREAKEGVVAEGQAEDESSQTEPATAEENQPTEEEAEEDSAADEAAVEEESSSQKEMIRKGEKDEPKGNEKENKAEENEEENEKQDDSGDSKNADQRKEVSPGLISWGHATSGRKAVDTVIVHSVYNSLGGEEYSLNKILDIFKSYDVSAHYIIDREGRVHQLVSEKHVSWHAGAGKMPDGRTNINSFSIGIELINAKDDKPTGAQYSALKNLISEIKSRHKIKYVLGHDDIAPGRKTDPWNFDWSKIGGKED